MTHIMRLPTHSDRIEQLASHFYWNFCNLTNSYFLQANVQLLTEAFNAEQRGESSWSDSAYVSKVKPSTCTHMCIVVICLQNSLRFKNKQLIELSALSALSQSLSTSRSKNTNYHFLYWMFLKLVTFQYFVVHLSLLEWLLPPKRARGRDTIIWA